MPGLGKAQGHARWHTHSAFLPSRRGRMVWMGLVALGVIEVLNIWFPSVSVTLLTLCGQIFEPINHPPKTRINRWYKNHLKKINPKWVVYGVVLTTVVQRWETTYHLPTIHRPQDII